MNGVPAMSGARILLAGDQRVERVDHAAVTRSPSPLLEVRGGDVAHLEQVGDVEVLGLRL